MEMQCVEGLPLERPHAPNVPDAPFPVGSDCELIWGRLNGLDEALAILQHGHNLLASALEELKGSSRHVDTPPAAE